MKARTVPHHRSRGFVLSLEYLLLASILGLAMIATLMGHVRGQLTIQLVKMEAAVVSLNDESAEPATITATATEPVTEGGSPMNPQ